MTNKIFLTITILALVFTARAARAQDLLPTLPPIPSVVPSPSCVSGVNCPTPTSNSSGTNEQIIINVNLPSTAPTGSPGFSQTTKSPKRIIVDPNKFPGGRIEIPQEDTELIFNAASFGKNKDGWILMLPHIDINLTLNFASLLKNGEVTVLEKMTMEKPTGDDKILITIPENAVMNASGDSKWDGKVSGPKVISNSLIDFDEGGVELAFDVGSNNLEIRFDKPIEIIFEGKSGMLAGYIMNGKATKIETQCASDTPECYLYKNGDLVVKTNHFTQFFVFKKGLVVSFWPWGVGILAAIAVAYIVFVNSTLLKKAQALVRVNEAEGEYVDIASHELKTPLTAIKGYLSMLLSGDFGPVKGKLKKPLESISSSTQRLSNLVGDMLDASRIKAGRLKLNLSDFAIDKVVKEVVETLTPIAKEEGAALNVKGIDKVSVWADSDKVKQILTNLIGNAIKFAQGGRVTLSSEDGEQIIKIFINNTGPAIPKDEQSKLFGKFQQAGPESSQEKGTGLGLYISRQLARRMGGDVWLEGSEVGRGTTFGFSLSRSKGGERNENTHN